jgi:hypothetical protein
MAKRGLAWQQPPPSQPMRHKLLWRFLGLAYRGPYTLKQSHGLSPFSVLSDTTTIEEKISGDYLSVKTVRSIVLRKWKLISHWLLRLGLIT